MSLPDLPPEPPVGWQAPQGWAPPPAPTTQGSTFGPLVCTLCGTPLVPAEPERCPACGLHQQLGPTRANPFSGAPALVTMFGTLAIIYALTYLIIAMK